MIPPSFLVKIPLLLSNLIILMFIPNSHCKMLWTIVNIVAFCIDLIIIYSLLFDYRQFDTHMFIKIGYSLICTQVTLLLAHIFTYAFFEESNNFLQSIYFTNYTYSIVRITIIVYSATKIMLYYIIYCVLNYIENKEPVLPIYEWKTDVFLPSTCSICLTEDTTFHQLECKHLYHAKCIEEWCKNHNTCPLCRNKISIIV